MYLWSFLFPISITFNAYAQNVGININDPESALDVNGNLSLRSADLTLSDGANLSVNVNSNAFSNLRISGPNTNFSLSGLMAPNDGRVVLLLNNTDYLMSVINLDANAVMTEQIITGTGGNLDIYPKGSITIIYDGFLQKWVVKNYHSSSSLNAPAWHLTGNANTDENQNFIGTTDNKPVIIKSFNQTINSAQNIYGGIGTNVEYRAGDAIILQNNFRANFGSTFKAKISTCNN